MSTRSDSFPVKDLFEALDVLDQGFDISSDEARYNQLHVDFGPVRAGQNFKRLLLMMGILGDQFRPKDTSVKYLFTGQVGCGKSVELVRLHHCLNQREFYFSVHIDLWDSFQPSTFEAEDLFVGMISRLVEELDQRNIPYDVSGLRKLAQDWVGDDPEITQQINKAFDSNASAELSVGAKFWHWLAVQGGLKAAFSYQSKISEVVRKKIKRSQGEYVITLNQALREINSTIRSGGHGQQIIFIIDGIEKLRGVNYEVYLSTFFRDARLIRDLSSNIVCCVPIDSMYDGQTKPLIDGMYQQFMLPMVPVTEVSLPLFREIVTRRIDEATFFEPGALDFCILKSGGNPRQLLNIVLRALSYTSGGGDKITLQLAEKTCAAMGRELRNTITSPRFDVLREAKDNYEGADDNLLFLLYQNALMEYNGDENRRKPNPLLESYLDTEPA
jgi:hypothetical protein